ncbi:MAG: diguanylate cyclase [Lachnospiraceae bacterium]|nr:diguanylate cyclase [Lachnospiraceae bacterium]
MIYAMVPASLLIIGLILNHESIKKFGFREKKQGESKRVAVRFNVFALTADCYLTVDMFWGLLYEHNDVPVLFPFIYVLTVFYFMFMLLTMLTWTRYIVAYLDRGGWKSEVMLHGVWGMFLIGVMCLLLNQFYHFMFSYNEANEYVGETGRNLSFLLQIAFYVVLSGYTLFVAHKSSARNKLRFRAVAATSVVLGASLVLQICFALLPSYAIGLMVGICIVHSYVILGEKKEKEIHDHIASVMAEDYEAIFYIDKETGEYISFAESKKYMNLNADASGRDFFREAVDSIEKCVYPEDWEYAKAFYDKESMLKNLEGRRSFSFKYRIMVEGEPRYFLFTVMSEKDGKYLIFYEKDIEDELVAETTQKENQRRTVTFGRIAESLASNYDVIYYVDVEAASYISFEVNNIYGQLQISASGDDFFEDIRKNVPQIIHKQDVDRVIDFLSKDNLLSMLENHNGRSIDYRLIVSGKPRFTRLSVRKTSDRTHFIIGVEDIDAEVKREKQQLKVLKSEKELARRDELTGVKNKTAYKELVESVQGNMDNGMDYLTFALVVCDANNLKQINDTYGHAAGDEYIKSTARLLCDVYAHSPIFRVGGDEFIVFLRGTDYTSRQDLLDKLREQVLNNKKAGAGVILASGMSEYRPDSDTSVTDIFERADKEMYENKQKLKSHTTTL